MDQSDKKKAGMLESLAGRWVKWASGPRALEIVLSFLAIWLFTGPFMKFSSGWQMIMGTTSAAVTLVMVFLLVRTQAKDMLAIQMKLNEVIGALQGANNQLISIEHLNEIEIQELSKRYETVATKLLSDDVVSTESIISHEIVANEEKQSGE
jgi:low affinity Fe/Cu permease